MTNWTNCTLENKKKEKLNRMAITNMQVHRKCDRCSTRMLGIMIQSASQSPRKICWDCEQITGLDHMGEVKTGEKK